MLMKFSRKILIFILTFLPIFLFLMFLKKNSSETVTLNVYNWGDFMSLGGDSGENVNELFTQKTGIKINYTTFQSNEEMMAKIMGGGAEYDVIFTSDYCVPKLIYNDLLAEINFDNIPNYKLVSADLKNLEFNPDGKKYVAYSWGVLGIFYNKDYVKEKITWDLLWNKKYKNKILMLDNPRDALAISLLRKKKSINSEKIEDWAEAAEDLQNQKSLVSNYMSDQIFDKLIGEEDYIAPFYFGHRSQNDILKDSPNIKFDVPREGTNKFIDCACILKSSKHKKEAEEYINFLCGDEISYINSKVTGYFPANQNVAEKLIEKSEFLNSYDKNKFYVYKDLPAEISKFTDNAWVNMKAGNQKFHLQNLVLILIFLFLTISYIAILIAKIRKKSRSD